MLLHSDASPIMTGSRAECKQLLKAIGKESEERIRVQLKLGDKSVTMCKVLCHAKIKELENTLELPKNTPEDTSRFFEVNP